MSGLYTGATEDSFKSREEISRESLTKPVVRFESPEGLKAQEWFDEAGRRSQVRLETTDEYNMATIELNIDRPSYIGFSGDWHLGSKVNLPLLQRDLGIMANHPDVVGNVFLGDLTDSANFNPAQDEGILNFEEQRSMMMSMLDYVGRDRILALWKGNHDHKWERKHGTSKYAGLSQLYEAPVFYGNAFIQLIINGREPLRLMGSHQLRGSSIYNNAHPVVRAHREVQGLDFAFCGHTHRKGMIKQPMREFGGSRLVQGFVVGTYQYSSEYGKDSGWGEMYDSEQGMLWLKISPNSRELEMVETESLLR